MSSDIINKEAAVSRLIEEARLASSAVQNIADNEVESLMPVGIGVYVKSLIPPVKKLLINIGAGVTIEKNREDTINYIESRLKEFEVALIGNLPVKNNRLQSVWNKFIVKCLIGTSQFDRKVSFSTTIESRMTNSLSIYIRLRINV